MSEQRAIVDWRAILFDSAPIGICIIRDEKVQLANAQLVKIMKYPRGYLEGREYWKFVHLEDVEEFRERMSREPADPADGRTEENGSPYEVRLVDQDDKVVWVDWVSTTVEYEGKPAILGHVLDITERKRMQQRLIQRERFHASGETISAITHNVNNLLVGVLGYAELLHNQTDPTKIAYGLARISESGRNARDLTWKLQDATRDRRDQTFLPVNLAEVIREAITIVQQSGRARMGTEEIAIDENLNGELIITGDAMELGRAMSELILNAVDAMPDGGKITFRGERNGEEAVLHVSDTGTGIDGNMKGRIFDPLFTTKADAGSGMGLAIVYGTIQRHGGEILVDSEPGKGTTFTLRLPYVHHARQSLRQAIRRGARSYSHGES